MKNIAIIDFVSDFSRLVEQAVIKVGGTYTTFSNTVEMDELKKYDGIIFTGSSDTVYDGGKKIDKKVFELNKPILGICYGHQLVHYLLGGEVRRSLTPEHGNFLFHGKESKLFKGLKDTHQVHMSHNDEVVKMAPGFENIGYSRTCAIAATQNEEKKIYTLQFHPESYGNECGIEIYRNFLEI